MDIVITRNDFWTLANVVIADLTCANFVQHVLMIITHATTIAIQNKAQFYTKQTLGDDFIPLAIKTYGCFHPCFDSFFISCVHANIICYQQISLVPSMFIFYYKQQLSIAFQHV